MRRFWAPFLVVVAAIGGCARQKYSNPILCNSVDESPAMPCEFLGVGQSSDGAAIAYFSVYYGRHWDGRQNDNVNWGQVTVPVKYLVIIDGAGHYQPWTLQGRRSLFYNVPDSIWLSAILTVTNGEKSELENKLSIK
jgi:hypothetical protein